MSKLRVSSGVALIALLMAGCSPASTPAAPQGSGAGVSGSAAQGSGGAQPVSQAGSGKLVLGGYTTPREAYAEIIPLFKKYWKGKASQDIDFQESYLGSGAQSRAIIEGFEADIAALSLEDDINRIQKAGLITHDWKSLPHKGMVTDSVVVLLVRKGNPKGIKDWKDLAQPGLNVLTPNPKTSGGAMWNIMALYGAARRGGIDGVAKDDDNAAQEFLKSVLKNVSVMDKGARESLTTYEKGIGDVAITYENEALAGRASGQDYESIIPHSTILIENPVAVVDKYADQHGMRPVAEGFVNFLWTQDAQRVFAKHGFRVVDPDVAKEFSAQYPAVTDLFTIDDFGGWSKVSPAIFGETGLYTQAIEQVQGQK